MKKRRRKNKESMVIDNHLIVGSHDAHYYIRKVTGGEKTTEKRKK